VVSTDGVDLCYVRSGRGGDILLIHGLAASSVLWQPLVSSLVDSFRVTSLDLPGHGGSGSLPQVFSISDLSNLILRFIDEVGLERPLVVAHSFGCLPVVRTLQSFEGRGVALLSPYLGKRSALSWFVPMLSDRQDAFFRVKVNRRGVRKVFLDLVSDPGGVDTELLERMLDHVDVPGRAEDIMRMSELVGDEPIDWAGHIASTGCPVLLAAGREDPLLDQAALERVAAGTGARLVMIERCGHFPQVERTGELARVLREFA